MRTALLLLAVLLVAGCGGHRTQTPEQVARAWSAALDRNDNRAAGALFAPDAKVVQQTVMILRRRPDAVAWNAALPCGGAILSVTKQSENTVIAVFRLDERPNHVCDGPGQEAAAIFEVRSGRIVLWHQVPVPSIGQVI